MTLAIWITWGISAEQTEVTVRGEYSSKHHLEYAEDRIEKHCLNREREALMDCIHQEITSGQEHYRSQRDLYAQEQMALWAKIMTLVTLGGAVIGMASVALLYKTIQETRMVGRDQSRAYLSASGVDFYWGGSRNRAPNITVHIKNDGQTPSKWFRLAVKHKVYAIEEGIPPIHEVEFPEAHGPWYGIVPKGDPLSTRFFLEDVTFAQVGAWPIGITDPTGRHGLVVFGQIEFCTFFDEIFVSQFCFGGANLRDYQLDRVEEVESTAFGFPIKEKNNFEKPIELSRFSIEGLRLYERQTT